MALAMLLTSCIDITEKMVLRKNGSGTYSVTYDLSRMFQKNTWDGINQLMAIQGDPEGLDLEKIISAMGPDQDTTLRFDSSNENPEVVSPELRAFIGVSVTTQLSKAEPSMRIVISKAFSNVEEVNDFITYFDEIRDIFVDQLEEDEEEGDINIGEVFKKLPGPFVPGKSKIFDHQGKILTRYSEPFEGKIFSDLEGSSLVFSLMGAPQYSTIIELPKKVKSASNQNAKIEGNIVRIEHGWNKLGKNTRLYSGDIKY